MNFHHRIAAIVSKELHQLARDQMTFAMIVMIPLVQLLLFGYAINTDVRHLPAGLVNQSHSAYARLLANSVEATQVVQFHHHYTSVKAAEQAITRGEVRAVLILPQDLTERLAQGKTLGREQPPVNAMDRPEQRPAAQWLVDGSDTMITAAIRGLRNMPLDELVDREVYQPVPSFEMVPYFNPEQRNVVNSAPGLVAVILSMTMIMFTSASLVREREQGNMEFLITTPVRPLELMIGKIIPFVFVGLVQAGIVLALSHWVFRVPINGSLLTIGIATLLFIMASLVLGLLISIRAQTQLQAMQMTFFILLPSILLSGFMFPYEAMPVAAQWIAEVLPATHFVRTIRGVVLRDADLGDLMPDISWLIAFALLGLLLAALRFNKRLD
jgi:ABC-2 type transport system permease protein